MYLGVIDQLFENGDIKVSYLSKTDDSRKTWVYPDGAEVYVTKTEQLLRTIIKVVYMCSVRVTCEIEDNELIQYKNKYRVFEAKVLLVIIY